MWDILLFVAIFAAVVLVWTIAYNKGLIRGYLYGKNTQIEETPFC